MRILLTGATGYIGSVVAEALLASGHDVIGLARSPNSEQKLASRGIKALRGDLRDSAGIAGAAGLADAVIQAGATNDGVLDAAAVQALLSAHKRFVYTSGVWVLGNTGDVPADESAPLQPPPIVAWLPGVERQVLSAGGIVIRPGVVYGRGGSLTNLFPHAGGARYIGDGGNRWAMVHVEDLADLYVLALEKAAEGTLYLASHGPSCRTREIAETASMNGQVESLPIERAREMYGPALVEALLLDQVVSAAKAKSELGWAPRAASLMAELRNGSSAA